MLSVVSLASGGAEAAATGVEVDGSLFFFFGERLLARIQIGLAFRKFLRFLNLMLGLEMLSYPAFDFRVSFRFCLVFLTGADAETEGDEKRKKEDSFHKQ